MGYKASSSNSRSSEGEAGQMEALDIKHMDAEDPHDAVSQASSSMPMSSSNHRHKIIPIPFVCKRKENCKCSCCEQPFGDNEIAKDIYVVYARWDHHKKQFIPVCDKDHVFDETTIFTSSLMWEAVGTCFFVGIALTFILLLVTSDAANTHYDDHHHYYPYQDSSKDTVGTVIVVAAVGPLLLLACLAAGLFHNGALCNCF